MLDYSEGAIKARLSKSPSLLEMLRSSAARKPNDPALVFYRRATDPEPEITTYGELLTQTEAAAAGFASLGINPEDGIAILLPTIPESVAAFIAASAVGVAFPINLLLSAKAIAHQLELSNAKAAIVMDEFPGHDVFNRLSKAAAQSPHLQTIIKVSLTPNMINPWQDFLNSASGVPPGHGDRDRIAALFHTGGTTGNPKLAQLSQLNLAAGAFMSAGAMKWQDGERVMVCLPMFHVGGNITCTMSTLVTGGAVVFPSPLGARDPDVVNNIWSMIEKSQTSALVMAPTSLSAIYDIPIGSQKMNAFRGIVTGATALSPDLGAAIQVKTGRPISQIYGMTETSGVCTTQPCDDTYREHAVGYLAPLMELKINSQDGRAGERGDVQLRGPNSFKGYRTSQGVADAPINGWVETGDIGQIGPDGQLRLLGRAKDTIIRSGHNIDPLLVEETVQAHPAIRQAAAVAMPDAYAGEIPTLYVSLRPGHELTTEQLANHISEHIAEPPARPKHIFILDELPLTPVGKIARFRLRQTAAIWQATKVLTELPITEICCDDTSAKELSIHWTGTPSDQNIMLANSQLTQLGLRLVPQAL
ncbi:MAG: AMP-binding protein [Alphaproteobacteria bacterium]|nr:AMP-binding protein [Alphaproteobacteria bacterium]